MIVGSNLKMNIGNSQISSACEFYVPPTINGATTTAIIVVAISAKKEKSFTCYFHVFFIYKYY